MSAEFAQSIIEHLWQSTLFGVACGVLIFCLRKGSTSSRHFIAWAAILKFLIPLQAFLWIGDYMPASQQATEGVGATNLLSMLSVPAGLEIDTSLPDFSASGAAVEGFAFSWLGALSAFWIIVTLVLVVNWARMYARAMRLKRMECVPADSGWTEMAANIWGERTRKLPELLVSMGSSFQPGVFGIFRQSIIIPQSFEEALTSEEREHFLRHELAHAASRDTLWLFVQQRIRDLFWFHPLVWWMDSQISLLREILRDEVVITKTNNKKLYLNCLMKASMIEQPGRCDASVGLKDSSLGKRALAIARYKKSTVRDWISNTIGAATIAACMSMLVLSVANSQAEELESIEAAERAESIEAAEAFFAERGAKLEKMKAEGHDTKLESTLLNAEFAEHKAKLEGSSQQMTDTEEVFFKEVLVVIGSGSREEALDLLLSKLNEDSSAPLYFFAGNLFAETEKTEKAMDFYRVALDRNPSSALRLRTNRNLGIMLVKDERWEEAAQHLQEAMYLGASDGTTYGLLGLAYVHSGKHTAAEYYYEKAIELDPETRDWKLGLAKSLSLQEKNQKLIPLVKGLIEQDEEEAQKDLERDRDS